MEEKRFVKIKDNIIDTLVGFLAVAILVTAVNLWIDVDRLKASDLDIKEDIQEIKSDAHDVRVFLMGEKK